MATLRSNISDVVNILQKILLNTTVADEQVDLSKIISVYFILWQQVILDQIEKSNPDYKAALGKLDDAEGAAKRALVDLSKVVDAIKAATAAAKAVDKVVNLAVKLIP
jgi:hypothetical protein